MSEGRRPALSGDGGAVAEIYRHYVLHSAATFEVEPPTSTEMTARIEAVADRYPYDVWEEDGEVVGFAYAGAHRARAAYAWSAESSVYLAPHAIGRGIGAQLYRPVLERLDAQGFASVFAAIVIPNDGSIALHRAVGFEPIGCFEQIGFKFDRWHDVSWMRRPCPQPNAPEPPRRLSET